MADDAGSDSKAVLAVLAELDEADAEWERVCDAAGLSRDRRELVLLLSEVQTLRHELAGASALCEARATGEHEDRDVDAAYCEVDYALTAVQRATAVVRGVDPDAVVEAPGPIDRRPLHRGVVSGRRSLEPMEAPLWSTSVHSSGDGTLQLRCDLCRTVLADVEDGDVLASLAGVARDHVCPERT